MSNFTLPFTALLSSQPQSGAGWQLLENHACGGFKRQSFSAWVYPLSLLPAIQETIDDIGYEQFLGDISKGLDDGVEDKQRNEYRSFLLRHGLTVNETNLGQLSQGIYPMDASEKNLQALVGSGTIKGISLDGLQIAVLGENSN